MHPLLLSFENKTKNNSIILFDEKNRMMASAIGDIILCN
jgi:hypothetical protein